MSLYFYCEVCGSYMCENVSVGKISILITPCDKCLDNEYKYGYEQGKEDEKQNG